MIEDYRKQSKTILRVGWALGALPAAFLAVDGIAKLIRPQPVLEAFAKLGFPERTIIPLGVVNLVCAALYLFPRTAVLGAILSSGYLGGAVAAHVRIGDPLLWPSLFPAYLSVLMWLGLVLRDRRLQSLLPLRDV